MAVGGWIGFAVLALVILSCAALPVTAFNLKAKGTVVTMIIALVIIGLLFLSMRWYYQNTASGQRALIDQKSELANGLYRTITVYTADGNEIAKYTGNIDIEGNDGGYVLFDFEGKRYTYYNCFVESIAEID